MKTFPSGDNGGHVYIYDHATTGMIPKELWAQEAENKNNGDQVCWLPDDHVSWQLGQLVRLRIAADRTSHLEDGEEAAAEV